MKHNQSVTLLLSVVAILLFINCFRGPAPLRAREFQFVVFSNTVTDDGVHLEPDPQTVTSELLADGWSIINATWNPTGGQLMIFMQR